MSVPILLCAACGSHLVDVYGWQADHVAVLRCASCAQTATLSGFTVGRVWHDDEASILQAAIADAAIPQGVR